SVDLVRLAGLNPAAVICEIMKPDGTMARLTDLVGFAEKHHLKVGTIVDLIKYRVQNETLVSEVAHANLPNKFGTEFQVRVFRNAVDDAEHVVLQKGPISDD